jgi:uncharacterized membrane protein HdeD (DUF308 family)
VPMVETVRTDDQPWWLVLIEGVALLVLSFLMFTAPGATLAIVAELIGFFLLIAGIVGVVSLARDRHAWAVRLIAGILGIVAGLAVIRHPLWSSVLIPASLTVFVGAIGAAKGVLDIVRSVPERDWGGVTLGIIGILIGLILLANPLIGVAALPIVLGIVAGLGGASAIAVAFLQRRSRREAAAANSTDGAGTSGATVTDA